MNTKDLLFRKVITDTLRFNNLSISDEKMDMLLAFILSDSPVVIYREGHTLQLISDFVISMTDGGLIIDPTGEDKVYDFIHNDGTVAFQLEYEHFDNDAVKTSLSLGIPFNSLISDTESNFYTNFCMGKFPIIRDFVQFFNPDILPEKELDPAEQVIREFLSHGDS